MSGRKVNFYQTTRRNNPEDSRLHTRRRENTKSHRCRDGSVIVPGYEESSLGLVNRGVAMKGEHQATCWWAAGGDACYIRFG
jgi:hypothetical protein